MMMLTEPLIVILGLMIAVFIVMAKNVGLKDNQAFILMIPLVLTIAVIGYNFDYAANPNNDLSRFMHALPFACAIHFGRSSSRSNCLWT